jgi:hypothetical protein
VPTVGTAGAAAARKLLRRAAEPWAALVACALILGACGGSSTPVGPGDRIEGRGDRFDVPVGQATCADWEAATERERLDVLDQLRANRDQDLSGPGVQGRGSVLDDDYAYRLLDNRCGLPVADSFLLYKLYAFAAAFAGTSP